MPYSCRRKIGLAIIPGTSRSGATAVAAGTHKRIYSLALLSQKLKPPKMADGKELRHPRDESAGGGAIT